MTADDFLKAIEAGERASDFEVKYLDQGWRPADNWDIKPARTQPNFYQYRRKRRTLRERFVDWVLEVSA